MSLPSKPALEKGSVIDMETMNNHHGKTDMADAENDGAGTQDARFSDLPPVDRGHAAWLFLAGCYVMEALVFGMLTILIPYNQILTMAGFGFSFGVLQDYYSTHAPFAGTGNVATIGSITTVLFTLHFCIL
jgi:hypothetical protein